MTKRDLIAAVNGAVDMVTFEQIIPSMDDIFISAVRASEAEGTTPPPVADALSQTQV